MTRLSAGAAPGWMTAKVAGVEFALAIETVGEVVPTPPVSPVPLVPAWIAGIVSIRGDVVPVIDPGMRLFGRPANRDGRLVLAAVDEAGERVGLLVDSVTGLIDRSAGSLEAKDEAAPAARGGLPLAFTTSFVTRSTGGRVPVLHLVALLDAEIPEVEAPAGDA